jgi:hypothetical protein
MMSFIWLMVCWILLCSLCYDCVSDISFIFSVAIYGNGIYILGSNRLFFLTLPEHCNLSEDIQQSCLPVTINGM